MPHIHITTNLFNQLNGCHKLQYSEYAHRYALKSPTSHIPFGSQFVLIYVSTNGQHIQGKSVLFPHATIFSRWKNLYPTLFIYHAGAINGLKSLI